MNTKTDNDMAEKILKRLMSIIVEDTQLMEFSLIPTCDANTDLNVCPVKYARSEHCLALETWCLKHVFKFAQQQIFKLRKIQNKCRDNVQALDMYLTGAVLILPDVTTFWNIRRELFNSGYLHAEFEFRLSALVLSNKCKSFEAFAYRRWLLDKGLDDGDWGRAFEREAEVLRVATVGTANNYHAWNHRIWCFENVLVRFLPIALQIEEINFSENWIAQHVSEHSGFHYRQHMLNACRCYPLLPKELPTTLLDFNLNASKGSDFIVTMLDAECLEKIDENDKRLFNQYLFVLVYELLNVLPILHTNFPGHETIWYHRRFVLSKIHRTVCEIYGVKSNHSVGSVPNLHLPEDVNILENSVKMWSNPQDKNCRVLAAESSVLMKMVLEKERVFLEGICMNDNRWLNCDADFICKYRKWMRCVLGLGSF